MTGVPLVTMRSFLCLVILAVLASAAQIPQESPPVSPNPTMEKSPDDGALLQDDPQTSLFNTDYFDEHEGRVKNLARALDEVHLTEESDTRHSEDCVASLTARIAVELSKNEGNALRFIQGLTKKETALLQPEAFIVLAKYLSGFGHPGSISAKCRQALYEQIRSGEADEAVLGQLPLAWLKNPKELVNSLVHVPLKRFGALSVQFFLQLVASHPEVCQTMVPGQLTQLPELHLKAITPMCTTHMPDEPGFPLDLFPDNFFHNCDSVPSKLIGHLSSGQVKWLADHPNDRCYENFDLSRLAEKHFCHVTARWLRGFLNGQYSGNKLGNHWNSVSSSTMRGLMNQPECLVRIHVDDIYAMKPEYQQLFFSKEATIKAVSANWKLNMWIPKLSPQLVLNSNQGSWIERYMPPVAAQVARFINGDSFKSSLNEVDNNYLDELKELRNYLDQKDHPGPNKWKLSLRPFIVCALTHPERNPSQNNYLALLLMAIGRDKQPRIDKLYAWLSELTELKKLAQLLKTSPVNSLSRQRTSNKRHKREDVDALALLRGLAAFQSIMNGHAEATDAPQMLRENADVCAMFDACAKRLGEADGDSPDTYISTLKSAIDAGPGTLKFGLTFGHIVNADRSWAPIAMELLDSAEIDELSHLNYYVTVLERSIFSNIRAEHK